MIPTNQSYGPRDLEQGGRMIRVSADGLPDWKIGGITLDWSTIPLISGSAAHLQDGPHETIVSVGDAYLRYGRVLCEIDAGEVYTLSIDATGGTFAIGVSVNGGAIQYTTALAFGANAATIIAALEALTNVGVGDIAVVGTTPNFTLTGATALAVANLTFATDSSLLTGGHNLATIKRTQLGGAGSGKYGPYDVNASDGRQTLRRDRCFLINDTVLKSDRLSAHPPVFDGGRVYAARIFDILENPSRTALQAVLPRLTCID